jgi:hypothetical protein
VLVTVAAPHCVPLTRMAPPAVRPIAAESDCASIVTETLAAALSNVQATVACAPAGTNAVAASVAAPAIVAATGFLNGILASLVERMDLRLMRRP